MSKNKKGFFARFLKNNDKVDNLVEEKKGEYDEVVCEKKHVCLRAENENTEERADDSAPAENGESEYTVINGVLTNCNIKSEELIIPDGVERIDTYALLFNDRNRVKKLFIPASVQHIDGFALSGCIYLEKIEVAVRNTAFKLVDGNLYTYDGVTLVVYVGSKDEKRFVIPDGVITIGDSAFKDAKISEVVIPESVTAIGYSAFCNCYDLESVELCNGVKSIGATAFYSCKKLEKFFIPSSVNSIPQGAFGGCKKLRSFEMEGTNNDYKVVDGNLYTADGSCLVAYACGSEKETFFVPDNVKRIGNEAFRGCEYLKRVVIPDSVKAVGYGAFRDCKMLEKAIVIGEPKIEDHVFYECQSLKKIIIPAGVTQIGSYVFSWCKKLETVILPSSLKTIDRYCFIYCDDLSCIVCTEDTAALLDEGSRGLTFFKFIERYKNGTATEKEVAAWKKTVAQEQNICFCIFAGNRDFYDFAFEEQ